MKCAKPSLYIRRTIHGVGYNPMNDGGRYSIWSPILSNLPPTRPTLTPPFTDGSDTGKQPNARLEAGMELIMERLTRPGQTVCDPLMLDRSHSAIAAWRTGRSFIGATDNEANLSLIRDRLARSGAFSKLGK